MLEVLEISYQVLVVVLSGWCYWGVVVTVEVVEMSLTATIRFLKGAK